ncbi:MAG: acyl--CoA ligase [Clostridia bacterium]|nr:acyl--CoA ligase [Clostridia bacterium]
MSSEFIHYSGYGPRPENYIAKPEDQTMYEFMLECSDKIIRDHGDYTAFVNVKSATSVKKVRSDVEKVAAFLAHEGFGEGDVITVFLPTGAHAFPVLYALNKLGIIANIVHPLTPAAELRQMLADTNSKGMFILDRLCKGKEDIISSMFTVVCSTSDYVRMPLKLLVKADDKKNSVPVSGERVHYFADVMKSSFPAVDTVHFPARDNAVYLHGGGTTGKSKTVMLSNYALNSLAYGLYLLDRPHDYGNSYTLAVLPIFHAFGLGGCLHYAMCNGYSALLMSKFDAREANELIKKYNVVEALGVPLMFKKMFAEDNFENKGLKNVLFWDSGGDFVSEEFVEEFDSVLAKNGSRAMFSRGWGLTELCAVCTCNNYSYYRKNSCGHALEGLELAVFDENGKKLPAGEVGEIGGRGATMMNGYLPDGTVEGDGFFIDENGEKWVLTGDMGYLDEDGYLFLSGRKKRIIIIAGYNVYPATVEGKIEGLDFIREVCCAQAYDGDKPFMRMYVSLKEGADRKECLDKLEKIVETELEQHSRPKEIEILDALPRTKMEKIDFLALTEEPGRK